MSESIDTRRRSVLAGASAAVATLGFPALDEFVQLGRADAVERQLVKGRCQVCTADHVALLC